MRFDQGELRFPLDPLWASPAVDFVGIDAYWPLSDWRDGADHLDAQTCASVYDLDYLRGRVASGEGYDWYYANEAARLAQERLPIADGAFGKAWVYRPKDLVGWWGNAHHERVGGVELAPTAWAPCSKPIWLAETGCPAVDRGANAPNVFPDAKSSESRLPYFSRGFRDDLMQARAIEATLSFFDPALPGFREANNPVAPITGARMVDPARVHVWAWDARPYPAFPMQAGVWADAANWETGHWLNGRIEGLALDRLVATLIDDARPGVAPIARPAIAGALEGYALDRIIAPRAAIEPLAALFGFDAIVSGGAIRFADRAAASPIALSDDDVAPGKDGALVTLTRAQESDLPHEIALTLADPLEDYRTVSVLSRRLEGGSRRASEAESAVVMDRAAAQRLVDIWLRDLWVSRETASFSVRSNLVALEVGDAVSLTIDGARRAFRIERIEAAGVRAIEARAIDASVYECAPPRLKRRAAAAPSIVGPPLVKVLDLAVARETPAALQRVALFADPWSGPMALWRAADDASFEFVRTIAHCATLGATLDTLAPGPTGRLDVVNAFRVALSGGALASVSDATMFAGRAAALRGPDGAWEIVGFAQAELVGERIYRLSRLLRGLGGEEALANRTLPAGADFVLLDEAVAPLASGVSALGVATRWRVGPAARDIADPAVVEFTTSAGPLALMPYAPVHARATRGPDGVSFSFIRRGRIEADAWEPLDVPLGEESERYELDILRAGASVRTLVGASCALVYAAADERADFGAAQSAFDVAIYQLSASVGRGFPLRARLAL